MAEVTGAQTFPTLREVRASGGFGALRHHEQLVTLGPARDARDVRVQATLIVSKDIGGEKTGTNSCE